MQSLKQDHGRYVVPMLFVSFISRFDEWVEHENLKSTLKRDKQPKKRQRCDMVCWHWWQKKNTIKYQNMPIEEVENIQTELCNWKNENDFNSTRCFSLLLFAQMENHLSLLRSGIHSFCFSHFFADAPIQSRSKCENVFCCRILCNNRAATNTHTHIHARMKIAHLKTLSTRQKSTFENSRKISCFSSKPTTLVHWKIENCVFRTNQMFILADGKTIIEYVFRIWIRSHTYESVIVGFVGLM